MQTAYQIYVGALALVCLAAIFQRFADIRAAWTAAVAISPLRRTAAAMFANALLNAGFVVASGIEDPWGWYIFMDALAAAIVLHQPAGKAQSVIGGFYMIQIVAHGVYGVLLLSGDAVSKDAYWQILFALASAQLLVLGAWTIGHHWRRRARRPGLRRRTSVAGAKGREGVAR